MRTRSGRIVSRTTPASRVTLRRCERDAADVDAPAVEHARAHEIRDAEEVGDECRLRALVDVARRAELLDPAARHHREPVRHRQRLLLVVRDVEEGDADLALDRLELDLELAAELRVERAERLVEQEHRRREHERARQRDSLLLPARELVRAALPVVRRAERARAPPPPGRRFSSFATSLKRRPKATFCSTERCGKSA